MKFHIECKPDETLVTALGIERKRILHHNDKGRFNKLISQLESKNEYLIGMVDEDPNSSQPVKLFEKLSVIVSTEHQVKFLRSNNGGHKLIVLCPKLEDWIIGVCKKSKVNMENFSLPSNPGQLHRIINSRLENLNSLVLHLVEIESPAILHLRNLINS